MPAPTPITFPELSLLDDSSNVAEKSNGYFSEHCEQHRQLVPFLQTLRRPVEARSCHLSALGLHVTRDASLKDLIPDPSVIPDFETWDRLRLEDVSVPMNEAARKEMSNGFKCPGIVFYLERKKELSYANQVAFRAIRRMPPVAGRQLPRLGNSFEFYKNLEIMATYWDDPSDPWSPPKTPTEDNATLEMSINPANDNSESTKNPENDRPSPDPDRVTYRLHSGKDMPAEARHNGVSAFLKMIVYEFKCNIGPARTEPRLQLREPPHIQYPGRERKASYFPSGCTFCYRTPTTRSDARAGVVEGPLFALSTRGSTVFSTEMDQAIDLGREVIAALITAQHRAREGKEEVRFGDGQWWCSKPRWGGGQGGPIGKEIEVAEAKAATVVTSTSTNVSADDTKMETDLPITQESLAIQKETSSSTDCSDRNNTQSSRLRKLPLRKQQMSIYDNYRMVRPPSCTWDKKTRYLSLGKIPGADYDDVFVVTSLFHHVRFIRVRVPQKLLSVLDGQGLPKDCDVKTKPWGELTMVKSKWFDIFVVDDRIQAMQHIWAIMMWSMRKVDQPAGEHEKGSNNRSSRTESGAPTRENCGQQEVAEKMVIDREGMNKSRNENQCQSQ